MWACIYFAIENKIVIICGGKSVEVNDTETDSYSLHHVLFKDIHSVTMVEIQKIYVIDGRDCKVLSEDLEIIEERESKEENASAYTRGNIVV